MKIHSKNLCSSCGKGFELKGGLTAHTNECYACFLFSKVSSQSSDCDTHKRSHALETLQTIGAMDEEEMISTCNISSSAIVGRMEDEGLSPQDSLLHEANLHTSDVPLVINIKVEEEI